jgi:hypothetical protein
LGKEIVMDQVGLVVITRNEAKVLKRFPQAVRFFPYMWWCPADGDTSKDSSRLKLCQWAVGGLITLLPCEGKFSDFTVYGCDEPDADNIPLQPCVWTPKPFAEKGGIIFGDICVLAAPDEEGETSLITLEKARSLIDAEVWLPPIAARATATKVWLPPIAARATATKVCMMPEVFP